MSLDSPKPVIIRKRDLFEAVVLQTGVRKGEVREVIEALLEKLHFALENNAEIHVPPLGRIKPILRETDDGPRMIYKLHLMKTENQKNCKKP
ncbi:hypothetical protein BFP76_05230 [Amylibacter kogurei]|uniref:DNA-binding protein n=1 Tax=Paramylibacter kogurei TaxID=1889778 RepID=A0A2G5K6T6_9RHOB|nr:HU family DNA-binding protein [Amylibacter kogurei]PIB24590.1 hypothetical protein BFP76_05230 [Amylibacter kogurei]